MEEFDVVGMRKLIQERRDLAERARLRRRRRANAGIVGLVAVVVLAGVAGLVHQSSKGSNHDEALIQTVASDADPNGISIVIDDSTMGMAQSDEWMALDTSEFTDGASPEDLAGLVAIRASFVGDDHTVESGDQAERQEDLVTAAGGLASFALSEDALAEAREDPVPPAVWSQRHAGQEDIDTGPSRTPVQDTRVVAVKLAKGMPDETVGQTGQGPGAVEQQPRDTVTVKAREVPVVSSTAAAVRSEDRSHANTRMMERQARGAPLGEKRYRVQLSAFRSEKAAHDERKRLLRSYGNELMGMSLFVAKADLGYRGDLYRILTTELASREAAESIQQNLKEKGKESLIVRR